MIGWKTLTSFIKREDLFIRFPPRSSFIRQLSGKNFDEEIIFLNNEVDDAEAKKVLSLTESIKKAMIKAGLAEKGVGFEKLNKLTVPEIGEKIVPGSKDVLRNHVKPAIDFEGLISLAYMDSKILSPLYSVIRKFSEDGDFIIIQKNGEKVVKPGKERADVETHKDLVDTLSEIFKKANPYSLNDVKRFSFQILSISEQVNHFQKTGDKYLGDTFVEFGRLLEQKRSFFCRGCERLKCMNNGGSVWKLMQEYNQKNKDFQSCEKKQDLPCSVARVKFITYCYAPLDNKLKVLKPNEWSEEEYWLYLKRIEKLLFLGAFEDFVGIDKEYSQGFRKEYEKELNLLKNHRDIEIQNFSRVLLDFIHSYSESKFREVNETLDKLPFYDSDSSSFIPYVKKMINIYGGTLHTFFPGRTQSDKKARRSQDQIIFEILKYLAQHESSITELNRAVGLEGKTKKRIISKMKDLNFIKINEEEGRKIVSITDFGRNYYQEKLRSSFNQ